MSAVAATRRGLAQHGLALGALALLAVAVYGQVIATHPLDADNLIALSVGERSAFDIATSSFLTYAPGYRPVPYLSIWLQYQVHGLTAGGYFLGQVLLWMAAAATVYALAWTLGRSRAAAALAAAAFLVDERARTALWWIGERQTSLAVLFGATALVLALREAPRRVQRRGVLAAIAGLLLLAALSKEYGLAFAAAVPVAAWAVRPGSWRPALVAAVAGVALYGVVRVLFAGGASGAYCETMGYFGKSLGEVCITELGALDRLQQHAYNAGASLVGTFLPELFTDVGVLDPGASPSPGALVFHAVVAALAALGFWRLGRRAAPLLVLIVANAALNIMLYRTRNQVIGYAAVYIGAAYGSWAVVRWLALRPARRVVAAGFAAVALAAIGWQATVAADHQAAYRDDALQIDPCVGAADYPDDISRVVVRGLKERYGMDDPACAARREGDG